MTWPEGSEDPEGKASERNPDVVRSAHWQHFAMIKLQCWQDFALNASQLGL